MIRQTFLVAFVLVLTSCLAFSANAETRVPIPNDQQRIAATQQLAKTYRAQFVAATTTDAKSQVAQSILKASLTTNDAIQRYAMLRLSLDIARGAQDFDTAIASVKTMDRFYEIDPAVIQSQLNALRKTRADLDKISGKHSSGQPAAGESAESRSLRTLTINTPWPEGEDQIVYDLPAVFDDVVVGAGGQYLIFLIGIENKIVFFDVGQRKATHEMSVQDSDVRIAATADSFYLAFPGQNEIQRWSLSTFKNLSAQRLPFQHPVELIAAGFASRGPVYAGASQGAGVFLDGKSLHPLNCQINDQQYQRFGELPGAARESRVRVSANGKAFSFWSTRGSPFGFRTVVYKGRTADMYYDHDTVGYIAPSPSGELMYTAKGVFTYQTKPYASNDKLRAQSFHVPSLTGDYSVSVTRNDDREPHKIARVNIHFKGQPQPIHTIPKATIRPGRYGDFHDREPITLDRRIYLIPAAKMLITLPESNRSVVMHYLKDLPATPTVSRPSVKRIATAPKMSKGTAGPVTIIPQRRDATKMIAPDPSVPADSATDAATTSTGSSRKLPDDFPPLVKSSNPPKPFVGKSIQGNAAIPPNVNAMLENEYSPDSFDAHVALLKSPEVSLRVAAAKKICGVAFDDKARITYVARGLLLDPELEVRKVGLEALTAFRYSDHVHTALPEFLVLLGTGDEKVAADAIRGIAKCKYKAVPALPHLQWVIDGPDRALVSRACETVEYLGDVGKPLLPSLIKLINDESRFHGHHQAAHAIGAIGTEDQISQILTDARIDSINGQFVGDLSSLMSGMRERDSLSTKERELLEKATRSRDNGTAKDAQKTLDHFD